MTKCYNKEYMLEVLRSHKKCYPKDLLYEACMMLVKAKHYGIYDHWKLMLKNCDREDLFATECYLNRTLMKEKS